MQGQAGGDSLGDILTCSDHLTQSFSQVGENSVGKLLLRIDEALNPLILL